MAQEYIMLQEENESGKIALSKSVFELITDITIKELDTIVKVPSSKFSQSIQCKIEKNHLSISVNVRIKYGSNVNGECETLQHRIHQNILQMTSLDCGNININVNGFDI